MSYLMVAVGVSTVSTALAIDAQNKQAKFQEEQGRLDMVASNSATQQAEADARDQEAVDLSEVAREFLAVKSSVVAQQANSGISGVTSDRQRRNVDFQNSLDINTIKKKSDNVVFNIRQSGFSNNQTIQSSINDARSKKVGLLEGATKTALAGGSTYASLKASRR